MIPRSQDICLITLSGAVLVRAYIGNSSVMSASIYPSPKVSRIGIHVGVTVLGLFECCEAALGYLVNELRRFWDLGSTAIDSDLFANF